MAGETNDNAHEMEIENNSQDSKVVQSNMEFDENNGKTLSQAGPWFQAIKARKNKKAPNEGSIQEGGKQGNPQNQQGGLNTRSNPRVEASMRANSNQQRQQDQVSRTNDKPPPRRATPPLPENDYKVVYRPSTGMKLSSWPHEKITEGRARASGSPLKEFCANVTIQTQWKQNLVIASTADDDYALKLGSSERHRTRGGHIRGDAVHQTTPRNSTWSHARYHCVYDGETTYGTSGSQQLWHPACEDARQIQLSSYHLRRSARPFLCEGGQLVHTLPLIPQIGTVLQGLRKNPPPAGRMPQPRQTYLQPVRGAEPTSRP
ncbi:hypothetical protein HPB49_008708 [Dermacentor silvarum]|uniref:Uncharacterized protein n=1 Tax=Dermacentor silvarum TaxID=543639 RepID=A0ACB8DPA0_DERSI|nr:hypothetical protein HPB49_008708 [Dermacentor silvarum]